MNVVIDTNVLVSSLINPNGAPSLIVNLVLEGRLQPLYDNRIIDEYRRVLMRPKFGFNPNQIEPFLDYFQQWGEFVVAEPIAVPLKDRDDEKFYEVLVSGKGDYLITGNKNHFPTSPSIVSPSEFLAELRD